MLVFHLRRVDAASNAWSALLGKANGNGRPVTVGVGYPGQRELTRADAQPPAQFTLIPYRPGNLLAGAGIILLTLFSFLGLARHTGIIRDRGSEAVPVTDRPYSLARFQMAVWFFVIFGSMLYITVVLGDLVLSEQALMLLGIGTATQLGGTLVEQARSEEGEALPNARTEDFFRDLVTDAHGVSFHRFQMLVWTVTLAAIFVWQVYDSLTMPQFPPSLLALMGISSGTYVTFKAWERQAPAGAPAGAPEGGGAGGPVQPPAHGPGEAPAQAPVQTPQTPAGAPGQVNLGAGAQIFSAAWASDAEIAIMGDNFTAGTAVALNGVSKTAPALTFVDTQHLRLRVAADEAEPAEVVNLTVTNEDGATQNIQLT